MHQQDRLSIIEMRQAGAKAAKACYRKGRLIDAKYFEQSQILSAAGFVQFIFSRVLLVVDRDHLACGGFVDQLECFRADAVRSVRNERGVVSYEL